MQIGVEWAIIEINQFCFFPQEAETTNSQRKVQRNQRIINSVACFQNLSKKIEKVSKNRPAITKGYQLIHAHVHGYWLRAQKKSIRELHRLSTNVIMRNCAVMLNHKCSVISSILYSIGSLQHYNKFCCYAESQVFCIIIHKRTPQVLYNIIINFALNHKCSVISSIRKLHRCSNIIMRNGAIRLNIE